MALVEPADCPRYIFRDDTSGCIHADQAQLGLIV
jgi:hypothetical protein